MSEYIRLKDAIKEVENLCPVIQCSASSTGEIYSLRYYEDLLYEGKVKHCDYADALLDVINELDHMSHIKEIVQCKECIFCRETTPEDDFASVVKWVCTCRPSTILPTWSDDYCSCGVQKEKNVEYVGQSAEIPSPELIGFKNAYERGMEDAWKMAQALFDTPLLLEDAKDRYKDYLASKEGSR